MLADEIFSTRTAEHGLAIWWLGQSGFVVKSRKGTLVIDPYLSDSLTRKYADTARPHIRMTGRPVAPEDLGGVNLVLCSHKHTDHMDGETLRPLLEANPDAVVGLPAALGEHAASIGIAAARQLLLDVGEPLEHAGFRVRPVPAAHEQFDRDEHGRHRQMGFIVECGGLGLYHSGDSVVFDGLVDELPAMLDVMFLPINGRDPARGVAGNMSAAEAIDLAQLVRPRFVVPHHYDMFTFNTVPVSLFESEARRLPAGVQPRVLRCGQRWEVS
jgi:L-ascorbate metabolism protein UlaG (beta-lactamase superfamily)